MNSLATHTDARDSWKSRFYGSVAELADLWAEYEFMLAMFLDLCDLLQEDGFATGCEYPCSDPVAEDEALTELLFAEEVKPLPVRKLRLVK